MKRRQETTAAEAESRKLVEEVMRVAEIARDLQESAANLISRTATEEHVLRQRAVSLDADLRRLENSLNAAVRLGGTLDAKDADKLDEELCRARLLISDGDVCSLLPSKTHGRFLKMLLGPISVRATRKDVRLKVKEEYNNYRDRTAFMFLLFPSTLLVLRAWVWNGCFPAWPVQLYQAWLLFLYTSLALRENILSVNGSDIRPWWIYHHYCAMLMALISLTWEIKGQPDCASKQKGVQLFLEWAVMQAFAMLLQNRYQRQRLYTRIALGKARRMDVVWGETAGVDGQLWLLCPILFILQGFEAYVGIKLLLTALEGLVPEWQVVVCGFLLVLMAVGNFANTVQTLMVKSRFKAKMKRSRSKQELDAPLSPNNSRPDAWSSR